ncbi:MAG: hypothetical protein QW270_03690 [Candidatus Bathyarchaeia archaeon]
MAETLANIPEPVGQAAISGRYVFRDDFDSIEQWDIIAGSPSLADSILSLSGANTEVRSKRKFLYGILIVVAKASASGNLRIGFDDGLNDYVVWSGGNLRYKSTVDPTEGTTAVSITENSYNVFVILWEPDAIVMWVNGTFYGPYQGSKIPNKPLSISLKNLSTGTSQIDFVAVYPELVGTWLGASIGAAVAALALPTNVVGFSPALPAGTNRIGIIVPSARLLATPYTDSTTALGANASFTGTSRDTQISSSSPYDHYAFINAHAVSDQAGTLMIQESPDGSTWVTVRNQATQAVTNPDGSTVQVASIQQHAITLRYVRVAYRNGGTAQTSFRLSSRVYAI